MKTAFDIKYSVFFEVIYNIHYTIYIKKSAVDITLYAYTLHLRQFEYCLRDKHTEFSILDDQSKLMFKGYRCKSGFAIFAWWVTRNYAYSPFCHTWATLFTVFWTVRFFLKAWNLITELCCWCSNPWIDL